MHSLTLPRVRYTTAARVLGVLLFAAATALSARVAVPLPFSPVPLTLQVLVVILSGLVLGPYGALAAQALYLQAILLGAPLTAYGLAGPAAFLSPTAGYLYAFPAAAALAGWIAQRSALPSVVRRGLAAGAALTVIYAGGMAWLIPYVGGVANAWRLGVVPFVGADALKMLIAVAALSLGDR